MHARYIYSVLILLAGALPLAAQQFFYQPAQPEPGDTLTISYVAGNGPLAGMDSIRAELYYLGLDEPIAIGLPLSSDGTAHLSRFVTGTGDKALLISFFAGETRDNNRGDGYFIHLNENNDLLKGTLAARGEMLYEYHYLPRLPYQPAEASKFLRRELEYHPQNNRDPVYLYKYFQLCEEVRDTANLNLLYKLMRDLDPQDWMSEDQLRAGYKLTAELGLPDQQWDYGRRLRKEYDNELHRLYSFYEEFQNRSSVERREELYSRVRRAGEEEAVELAQLMAGSLAMDYMEYRDWNRFLGILNEFDNGLEQAAYKRMAAESLAGDDLSDTAEDLPVAEDMIVRGIEQIQLAMQNPSDRPPRYSVYRWMETLVQTFAWHADTYARILYKKGEHERAYEWQSRAVRIFDMEDPGMNERLMVYTANAKGPDSTALLLRDMLSTGYYTAFMRKQFINLYGQVEGPVAVSSFLRGLDSSIVEQWKAWYRPRLLDVDAPAFELEDRNGYKVGLEGLRNSSRILYFWATDCESCTENFPALELFQDQHYADPDLKLLLISTLEYVRDVKLAVNRYFKEHPYPFLALTDPDIEAAEAFNIRNLPAIAVIDRTGRLRYFSDRDIPEGMDLYYALEALLQLTVDN